MNKPYLPASGTEGADFFDRWCSNCARDKAMREGEPIEECDDNELCEIIAASFRGQVPEWIEDENGPRCTAFVRGDHVPEVDTQTADLFVGDK